MNAFDRARHMDKKFQVNLQKTLVIIDMQSGFMCEDEREIVPVICSLIRHARHREWAIIVVEYFGHGKTDKAILESLVGYPQCTTVFKTKCDGSSEVIECIKAHAAWSMDLLVCGIYGDECVAQTVWGIFQESDLAEVAVVTDAVCPGYLSCTEELADGTRQERELQTKDVLNYDAPVLS